MPTVKFIVDSEVAGAVGGMLKLVGAQKSAEGGFERMTAAGNRAERQQVSAVGKMVRAIHARTRSAELEVTQVTRAAARSSGSSALVRKSREVIEARQLHAQTLKDDRAFAHFLREQKSRTVGQAAGNMYGMSAVLALGQSALAGAGQRRDAESARKEQEMDAVIARGRRYQAAVAAGNMTGMGGLLDRGRSIIDQADERTSARRKLGDTLAENRIEWRRAKSEKFLENRQKVAQATLGVGAALTGVAEFASQELDRYGDEILRTETMLRPLYGVGDNMKRRGRIRQDVLASAGGLGIDPAQIAAGRFNLQSAASDLSPDVQRAIESSTIKLYKLQGSDMSATGAAMVAAVQLVGSEVARGAAGVKELENKLAFAADVGAFEIDQFAPYQAGVLGAFKGMGYTHEDAFAASAVASKSGQRPEAWSTAVRNLPLLMSEAQKKLGKPLSKDFGTAMGEISQLQSPELLEMVGRDTFVAAKILSEKNDLLRKYTEELKKITGSMDLIGSKLSTAWQDPTHATAEIVASARVQRQNAPATKAEMPWMADQMSDWEIRSAGAAGTGSPLWSWFDKPSVWMETALDRRNGGNLKAGVEKMISDAQQAGDDTKAGYLKLKYGQTTETMAGMRWSNEEDAKDWIAKRQTTHSDLSAGEYLEYRRRKAFAPSDAMAGGFKSLPELQQKTDAAYRAAEEYLDRVGRPGGRSAGGAPGGAAVPGAGERQDAAPVLATSAGKMDVAADKFGKAVDRLLSGKPGMIGNRHTE